MKVLIPLAVFTALAAGTEARRVRYRYWGWYNRQTSTTTTVAPKTTAKSSSVAAGTAKTTAKTTTPITIVTMTTSAATLNNNLNVRLRSGTASATGPSTTQTLGGKGTLTVPNMSAIVPLIQATATFDSNGSPVGAQVRLAAAGSIGVCADRNGTSTFYDDDEREFSLVCGVDIDQQDTDLYDEWQDTWEDCIGECMNIDDCNAVVYNTDWDHCWYKTISDQRLTVIQHPYGQLAYLPDELYAPLRWPSSFSQFSSLPTTMPRGASTTVIAATGTITVPVIDPTLPVVFTEATQTVVGTTTLDVNVKIRWK